MTLKARMPRLAAVTVTLLAGAGAWPAMAQDANLEGAWSGGGRITLSTGNSERATCRASFRRQGGSSYGVRAVCATPSARVAQTAEVHRVGANQFSGRFYNQEYDITGTIRLTASGNRMSVSLSGGGGSGNLELRR